MRDPATVVVRVAPWVALAGVMGLGLLLATRPLMEPDLGYHLEFGTKLVETGTIVDQAPYLYTMPLSSARGGERPEPVPGSWYDGDGNYRFANANWLSQLLFALVYRNLGGAEGLSALRLLAVLGILFFTAATAVRLGVPAVALAPGLLLAVLTSYERFYVRPELLGFLVLSAQAFLLAGDRPPEPGPARGRALGWGAVAGLVCLQWIAVNVHSYFLLGLGLTLAVLADRLGRMAWACASAARPAPDPVLRRSTGMLAAALAGQVVACLANPWGWRLALLPIQTVLYLRSQGITRGLQPGVEPHPWALITEAQGPFASITDDQRPVYAFVVLLVLGLAGAIGAVRRRRWDWLLVTAGMMAIALSMRRNMAPASMIVVPVALAAILAPRGGAPRQRSAGPGIARALGLGIPGITLAVAGWLALSVVTQEFFDRPASTLRFGTGASRLQLPLAAAEWIREHRPAGRIWTDFYSSSTVRFFSGGGNPMNLLTNGWAYPPDVLRDNGRYSRGERPFREAVDRYDLQVVVVQTTMSGALARELMTDESWRLVQLEGEFALFLRRDGLNADLAAAHALRPEDVDIASYAGRLERADPIPPVGLSKGAVGLLSLGWIDPGIELLERAIRLREATGRLGPNYVVEAEGAGYAHARRAETTCRVGMPIAACEGDLTRAEELLKIAANASPRQSLAARSLEAVQGNLARLRALKGEPR